MKVVNAPVPAGSLQPSAGMAPLIALVGCDGAGKTTLAADLCAALAWYPATYCYLGLGSRGIADRIARWPLVGRLLERRLSARASQARSKGQKIPGLLTALVIYAFSLLRLHRFRHMLQVRHDGQLAICDRYPQLDVAGFYDGPGLAAARASGPVTAWLARRERRLYERMVACRPTVVIRLNIDVETALQRKPDHEVELLRQKVAATSMIRFNGATIVDVDACQPYEQVRAEVMQIIQRVIQANRRKCPHSVVPAELAAAS